MLHIASIVEKTMAEGPGARFAVWVQGCPMRCRGCCNPDFLPFEGGTPTDPEALARLAENADVEGVSILGGEPFAQPAGLAVFARAVRSAGRSVMIFTGYTLAEIRAMESPAVAELLSLTDLLVDGRYDASLRTTTRRWVGSSNQEMHFLTGRYRPDDPQFSTPNTLEIHIIGDEITVNGWPTVGARTGLSLLGLERRPQ